MTVFRLVGLLLILPALNISDSYCYDVLDRALDVVQWANQPIGTAFQFSSYDRYGGNGDGGTFLRTDPDGSKVMAEMSGPGVISRIWVTRQPFPSNAIFRIFVDDTSAVIDTTLRQFFGFMEPFTPPLADSAAGGYYSYIPIHFQDTCRIVLLPESPYQALYYQITGIQFPETTQVDPFALPMPPEWETKLSQWESMWGSVGSCPWTPSDTSIYLLSTTISPNQQDTIFSISTPGVINSLIVSLSPYSQQILDDLIFRIYWDGSTFPSVDGTLGDIFGSHWYSVTTLSIPIGCHSPLLYSYFPCPFDACTITLTSQSPTSVGIQSTVSVVNEEPDTMRFWATTQSEPSTNYGQDYTLLSIEGRGHYIGCQLYMEGSVLGNQHNFLEGDQHIYVDGEPFPSIHGTGTEDDFNGGYYFRYYAFLRPIHGTSLYNYYPRQVAAYRIHLTDPIPFDSSITVSTEHGPFNNIPTNYHSVAYSYRQKNQVDFVDPPPGGLLFPGEHLTLIGWGFPPHGTITAYWGTSIVSTEPDPLVSDSYGGFRAAVVVPDTAPGFCRLGASVDGIDIQRPARVVEYRNTSSFEFRLSGMDTIAYPGTDTLSLDGQGFSPGAIVFFRLSDADLVCFENPTTVDSGCTFHAVAIVPDAVTGLYALTAVPSIGSPITSDRFVFINKRWVIEMEQTAPAFATSGDYCAAEFRGYPNYIGEWGDNLDLQLQSNAVDDSMTLQIGLPNSGVWNVEMGYTLFRYAGDFDVNFESTGYGSTWLGYSANYCHSGLVSVGTELLSQESYVTFHVVGKDPRSQNYWIGIDRLEFTPGIPPADSVIDDLTISIIPEGVVLTWSPIMIDSSGY